MIQRISNAGLLVWLLLQAGTVLGETAAEYFPLADGNTWTYQVTGPDGTYNETIMVQPGTTMINGVATKKVKFTGGPDGYYFGYWTNDEQGIRLHGGYYPDAGSDAVSGSLIFDPPMVLANRIMDIGETVNSSGKAVYTVENYGTFTLDYESSHTVAGIERVTVPAGSYSAIKITDNTRIHGSIVGEPYEDVSTGTTWLAKYIGEVKGKGSDSDGTTVNVLVRTNIRPPLRFLPFMPLLLDD